MMIAARNAFLMSGAKTPTARDYVQDGLVAMWDGIENAGWGQHDSSATVWRDIVGGNDFGNFASGCYLGAKSFHVPAVQNAAIAQRVYQTADISTIECVTSLAGINGLILVGFANGRGGISRWVGFRANSTYNFGHIQGSAAIGVPQNTTSYSGVYLSGSSWDMYRNGVPTTLISDGMSWGSVTVSAATINPRASSYSASDICCIRLYSRALTAAEVAANYAVDAARFGLSA